MKPVMLKDRLAGAEIRGGLLLQFALAMMASPVAMDTGSAHILRKAGELADGYLDLTPDLIPSYEAPELNVLEASLIATGKKIQAIKAYRDRTSLGLKDSKDVIDSAAVDITEAVTAFNAARSVPVNPSDRFNP